MRRSFYVVVFLILTVSKVSADGLVGVVGLDGFLDRVMKELGVPGVALAVVQDGKVIHSKGYGFRDLERKLPVTPKTLFAIGSTLKSFTATGLGVLVDEGKLDWDKPVREYLPDFRLHDPVAAVHMTPRDLVTHRSGLPRHDLVWYNSSAGRQEIFERLRYLELSKDFRSTFQYNNLMFLTAGYVAGRLSGQSWEAFTRERVLKPLGMNITNFSVLDSQKNEDHALPYKKVKDAAVLVPFRNIDQVGPAGSINSNIEEMSHYLLMHLQKGKHGGKTILSESNALQMQTPQMVMPGALPWKEVGHTSYGLGFMIASYRGRKIVHHGGNIDGFSALLAFLPQENLGVMVLVNQNGSPLPQILAYNVFDRLLKLDEVPWLERIQEQRKKDEAAAEEAKKKGFTQRRAGTRMSHDLAEYAGEYAHPGYGVARVEAVKDELKITFNGMSTPLRHFHYDVFEAPPDPLNTFEKLKMQFVSSVKGDISGVLIPVEPALKEILFTRQADRAMTETSFLAPLEGEYQRGGITATVAMKGKVLTLTLPGQPAYELLPARGLTFDVQGLNGFSIEFKKDAAGKASEAIFYQPSGTFLAKRKN